MGLSAGLALSACTDNDTTESASGQLTLTGDKAYLVVNIQDVGGGASTKATAGTGNFEYGTAAEYAVNDAHFYFYESNGDYALEGYNWNGGSPVQGGTVEFKSNTVVMLSGLTNNTAPAYVVTVLNKPAGFTPGVTLAAMETELASQSEVAIMKGDNTYFTMSTTSYVGGSNDYDNVRKDGTYFFVTKLQTSDFSAEPIPDAGTIDNYVEIYVERLAAKVILDVDADLKSPANDGLYKITYSGYDEADGETPAKASEHDYYVSLDGWTLDAIARQSYIVKNIDESWTNDATSLGSGWTWNDPADFRSYWGMSPNYGITLTDDENYPTSSGNETESTALNEYLEYVSLSDPTALGSCEYCGENTNTTTILKNKYSTAITNVLVKATICDENGEGLDLVRYDGVLFTFDEYCAYVLDELQNDEAFNVWIKVVDDDYEQISADYLTVANNVDGYIKIALKDADTLTEDGLETTFYSLENGEATQYEDTDDIQALLDEFNDNQGAEANGYKGGSMYYNIPIEHLNDNNTGTLQEANYGVVRNHVYYVTINKLEGLGHGIFDPEEVIVPQDESNKYYLASQVNILSWKIVEQGVDL